MCPEVGKLLFISNSNQRPGSGGQARENFFFCVDKFSPSARACAPGTLERIRIRKKRSSSPSSFGFLEGINLWPKFVFSFGD